MCIPNVSSVLFFIHSKLSYKNDYYQKIFDRVGDEIWWKFNTLLGTLLWNFSWKSKFIQNTHKDLWNAWILMWTFRVENLQMPILFQFIRIKERQRLWLRKFDFHHVNIMFVGCFIFYTALSLITKRIDFIAMWSKTKTDYFCITNSHLYEYENKAHFAIYR